MKNIGLGLAAAAMILGSCDNKEISKNTSQNIINVVDDRLEKSGQNKNGTTTTHINHMDREDKYIETIKTTKNYNEKGELDGRYIVDQGDIEGYQEIFFKENKKIAGIRRPNKHTRVEIIYTDGKNISERPITQEEAEKIKSKY